MKGKTAFERFTSKVKWNVNGCLEWTACLDKEGYGMFGFNLRSDKAHKFIYQHFFGPVPSGREIDHTCKNKSCVNPNHLEAVTHRVNVLRGSGPTAINAAKTHCLRGHPLSGNNLVRDNGRRCRICHYARNRRNWRIKYYSEAPNN